MRYVPDGDLEFQLDKLLNEGLELGDNVRGTHIEFETSGDVDSIQHDLGFVPEGYLVMYTDGEVNLHAARTDEWSSTMLYLKSNVANVTVRLFVQ